MKNNGGNEMKTFNSIEELKPYYNEKTNTYEFVENGTTIDVEFTFDLNIDSNILARNINAFDINAGNIKAWNIKADDICAGNIKAWNIKAWNICAGNISYFAVCFAYENITCTSIVGRRNNCKHFVLDGKIIFKEEKKSVTLELTDEQLEKIKELLGER